MPTPSKHKPVLAQILAFARQIGWTVLSREEAERRRKFDRDVPPAECATYRTLFSNDLIDAKPRDFYSLYFRNIRLTLL